MAKRRKREVELRGGYRHHPNSKPKGDHPWRNPLYAGGWKIRSEEARLARRRELELAVEALHELAGY